MVSKVRSLIPESASLANLLEMQMTRPHPHPIAPSTEGGPGNPVWQQALQVTLMHFAVSEPLHECSADQCCGTQVHVLDTK